MSGNYKGVTLTGQKRVSPCQKMRSLRHFFQLSLTSPQSFDQTNYERYELDTTFQVTTTDRSESCGRLGSICSARPAFGRRNQSRKSAQNRKANGAEERGRFLKQEPESLPAKPHRTSAALTAL